MMIDPKKLRLDGGTQPRAKIDDDLVNEYAEAMSAGELLPPPIVFYDGVNYWVADGFHRTMAAIRAEVQKIDVEVRQGDVRAAVLHSVGANAAHGLRRSNADKRRAIQTLLNDEEWGGWSNEQIAKRCGVNAQTVANHRPKPISRNSGDATPRKAIRNGSEYAINTAKIGSKSKTPAAPIARRTEGQPIPSPISVASKEPEPDTSAEPAEVPATQDRSDRQHMADGRLSDKRMATLLGTTTDKVRAVRRMVDEDREDLMQAVEAGEMGIYEAAAAMAYTPNPPERFTEINGRRYRLCDPRKPHSPRVDVDPEWGPLIEWYIAPEEMDWERIVFDLGLRIVLNVLSKSVDQSADSGDSNLSRDLKKAVLNAETINDAARDCQFIMDQYTSEGPNGSIDEIMGTMASRAINLANWPAIVCELRRRLKKKEYVAMRETFQLQA